MINLPNSLKHCLWLCLIAASLTSTGCRTYGPDIDEAQIIDLARMPYPKDSDYGDDLDVVVVYDAHWLRSADVKLINREPRKIGPGLMWLNQQYVARLNEPLDIGPDNTMSLTSFINYYREPFPVGLFFTPDASEPVVLLEFYDPSTDLRHRLYVQDPTLKPTLD